MSRKVRVGVTQAITPEWSSDDLPGLEQAMIDIHVGFVEEAAARGVQMLCFQELFHGPYFCAEQDRRWYALTQRVPEGPITQRFMELAKKHEMVLVLSVYEEEIPGVYYNTAAVIDADGAYLGKYRKHHIPHCHPGFWEKFYFKPGNLGYPVFETRYGRVGVYICYDRHFPEGARALGLNGAEIVFMPSATTASHSQYLWELEQVSHAVANGYFVATNNRVGTEAPWDIGRFFGSSYIAGPRGKILARGSSDRAQLVDAEIDLDMVREVREYWAFYRDRRPDSYDDLVRS